MAAELEREVIALAVRGLVSVAAVELVPCEAFTGAARLLAWVCACRVLRGCLVAWPPIVRELEPRELLAVVPAGVRDFVAGRLLNRVHETREEAKREIMRLGVQLQRMRLRRPKAADPFFQVRLMLVSVPRLEMPIEAWGALLAEAQGELDACERIGTLDPSAVDRLLVGVEDVGRV